MPNCWHLRFKHSDGDKNKETPMEQALRDTYYCDFNQHDLRTLGTSLSVNAKDENQVAKNIFQYVRDNISYGFDIFQRKASDTLRKGYGVCWNKALLVVALLRYNGIPAHFGSIPVKREFSRPVAGSAYRFTKNPFNHCVAHASLNGRWVVMDTILDKRTFQACYKPLNVTWEIGWDGESDCKLYTEHVMGPAVMHLDIDETLDKKVGNREWPMTVCIVHQCNSEQAIVEENGSRDLTNTSKVKPVDNLLLIRPLGISTSNTLIFKF